MTGTQEIPAMEAKRQSFLDKLMLATGLVFFWLLAFQGKDGVTPYGYGEHLLAMKNMAAGGFPYKGQFIHTEGHMYLFTALPWYKLAVGANNPLWGLLLYPRVMLSAAAILVYLGLRESGAGEWVRRLAPLAFLAHPYTLELARTFDGMADMVFYLTLAGYGLLSGRGVWTAVGVVCAVACRGLALPHALGISALLLWLHPGERKRFGAAALLMLLLIYGPLLVGSVNLQAPAGARNPVLTGWYLSVVTFHFQWVIPQGDRPLMLLMALIAGLPAFAAWAWALKRFHTTKSKLFVPALLSPLVFTALFCSGYLMRDQYYAPTLIWMGLLALLACHETSPRPNKTSEKSMVLPSAVLVLTLALTLNFQADRWPRHQTLNKFYKALNQERGDSTLYGSVDLVAQVLYERRALKLWLHYPQSDLRLLLAGVVDPGLFFNTLDKFPPDLILIDRVHSLALDRLPQFQTFLKKNYRTLKTKPLGTIVLYKYVGRY